MKTNRLARQKSPYLLQHAHNPVDWFPWGEEAFRKAAEEDKPIFLSVGYAACHWCHVMERESFEDEGIAALLNEHFVPVKVDREERPDVDRVYMLFVQATTGSGGWPMSVWLTPELRPFYGGTYFPPEDRYGRPGLRRVLQHVAQAWKDSRDAIIQQSGSVLEELRTRVEAGQSGGRLDARPLESGYNFFRRTFDREHGGFGPAPKFPQPSILRFLIREHARTGNREALDMVLATLGAMAGGGIRDHLGGGFHRYSVDERWFVPHFEKMLYDQAQLAVVYLEAFQVTGEESYAAVARDIFEYVLRDMTSPEGGFYSAEDADSAIDPSRPQEKGEGAFYLWEAGEIETLLGPAGAVEFCRVYGVEAAGNVTHDPHGEFTGKNILFEANEAKDRESLAASGRRLLAARSARPRPLLDDKILAAWNGLMISAFAVGAQVLEEPAYLAAARRAAEFVLARLWDPATRTLRRRYREGEAAIPGFAADYAFVVQGLLDLYEACFQAEYLEKAVTLTERQIELFADAGRGGFYAGSGESRDLVLRLKDFDDGAEPSANSVAAMNLLRLGEMKERQDFRRQAEKALESAAARLQQAPASMPEMLVALGFHLATPKQIVISGEAEAEDTRALLRAVRRRFIPNRVLLAGEGDRWPRMGKATAYVCENYVCQSPVTTVAELDELLE
ncbi:MAG: thioredoxin domain-containing protein [Bryobacteraceae bacterium]